ncbi:MAG: phage head closure protein [Desulfobulbaceae bacterium]|nr:phage head closure protein [Desulfobulbaceae bacterium]
MRAGRLRHRVIIQAAGGTANGYNEVVATWSNVATVWADVRPASGKEQWRGLEPEAVVSHEVAMRYRAGVGPANRLLFGSRVLNIKAVLNLDERNRELLLLCEEKPS